MRKLIQRNLLQYLRQSEGNTNRFSLKNIFSFKEEQENNEKMLEKQYYKLANELTKLNQANENEQLKAAFSQIYDEIKTTIDNCYELQSLKNILKLVPSKKLCEFAVEQYIGSLTNPKNHHIMKIYLRQAEINAQTPEEKLDVQYYSLYIRKLESLQKGDENEFANANEKILDLAEGEHKTAMHITAKELYKVALNITDKKHKRNKQDMMLQSEVLFNQAVEKGSFTSFYYLGQMAENGDLRNGIDLQYAYECYLIAASQNNPQAYFKLSIFCKEGKGGCQKNMDLHYLYMKKAAEYGLIEAQHNLGCMYLEKIIVPYNSIKALAWFTQAASAGFVHSMYNAAKMYLEGSEDGKIKINLKAGLVWLQKVKETGKLDVDDLIETVVEEIENQEQERENIRMKNI